MLASRLVRSSAVLSTPFKAVRSFSSTPFPRDFARVQIVGRIGIEPEIVETKSGQHIMNYAIAVNSVQKGPDGGELEKTTCWYNVTSYRDSDRSRLEKIVKGSLVMVDADYKIKTFEDRNGAKQVRHNLIHRGISVLSKPKSEESGSDREDHEDRDQ